jgi:GntR family transcriptional regulator
MRLQLNFKSGKPVYLQIVDQVRAAVAAGSIRAGEPLPSIRALAEEGRVIRNTVAKAYTELESLGVIDTAAGMGCFVRSTGTPLTKMACLTLLAEEVDQAVVQAHHLQVTRAEFLKLVEERLDSLEEQRHSKVAT